MSHTHTTMLSCAAAGFPVSILAGSRPLQALGHLPQGQAGCQQLCKAVCALIWRAGECRCLCRHTGCVCMCGMMKHMQSAHLLTCGYQPWQASRLHWGMTLCCAMPCHAAGQAQFSSWCWAHIRTCKLKPRLVIFLINKQTNSYTVSLLKPVCSTITCRQVYGCCCQLALAAAAAVAGSGPLLLPDRALCLPQRVTQQVPYVIVCHKVQ